MPVDGDLATLESGSAALQLQQPAAAAAASPPAGQYTCRDD